MSQALYLVRLFQGYRFPEMSFDWRRSAHPPILACFSSRAAAEVYVQTHLPLWQNPFDSAAIFTTRHDGIEVWRYEEYLPDNTRTILWELFTAELTQLGLPFPVLPHSDDEDEIQENLRRWWDTTPLTEEQKAALWRLLDPEPYEIVEVELEAGCKTR